MKFSCTFRLITACIALFSMLFMQLAVASYVCPGMSMEGGANTWAGASTIANHGAMVGCDGMDQAQPVLCHAHAYNSLEKQSLDKPQLPDIQPFVSVGLVLVAHVIDIAARPQQLPPDSIFLTRSTAPPLSIRNCCFRI